MVSEWVESADIYQESVSIGDLRIETAGLACRHDAELIVGSSASVYESPLPRARSELVERLSVLEAMKRTVAVHEAFDWHRTCVGMVPTVEVFPTQPDTSPHRWARSNGVAAGDTWASSVERAYLEAVERDRILRSWFGGPSPREVAAPTTLARGLCDLYEVRAYDFAPESSSGPVTAGVFAFPESSDLPLAYGFAAAASADRAIASATRECVQRLAFLWGEALPVVPTAPTPTPDFHQDFYLCRENHRLLRRWLRGGHAEYGSLIAEPASHGEPRFVDLSPADEELHVFVAKALVAGLVPLAFGVGHPFLARAVPEALAVHPIA